MSANHNFFAADAASAVALLSHCSFLNFTKLFPLDDFQWKSFFFCYGSEQILFLLICSSLCYFGRYLSLSLVFLAFLILKLYMCDVMVIALIVFEFSKLDEFVVMFLWWCNFLELRRWQHNCRRHLFCW